MMTYNLNGKVALITGAGRKNGIGAAIARTLARCGAQVVVGDICAELTQLPHGGTAAWEELAAVAAELESLGGHSMAVRVDVTDGASVQAMVGQIKERFGRLDILVNNAGTAIAPLPVIDMAEEAWRKTLAVNATGTFLACKYALPLMLAGKQGGRVINMASLAAQKQKPFMAAYAAGKAAVVALTGSLSKEMAAAGITVNAVLPGDIDTDLKRWGLQLESLVTGVSNEEVVAGAVAQIPLGRLGIPQDVANMVAFLASEEAAFLTGETFNVTGGR